uniref:Uncharacterized protein n=1 Tax=Ciona intestinalis TaxID=7719 RepID=H2XWF0_CIOIN
MNECNLLYPRVAGKRQSLSHGFNTSCQLTSYHVCYFVGNYFFWIFSSFLCISDNLDNPLVTTGLEQLP